MNAIWRPAYVAIGSNLDTPHARVDAAFAALEQLEDTRCLARSRRYRSRPMGPQAQPDFINAAAGFLTQRGARELLETLLDIERAMGRLRTLKWGPRVIDLDLIWLVGGQVDEPGLSVPHPGVSSRNFVLYPLNDIAPTLSIPGVGIIRDLLPTVGTEGICLAE